VHRAVGVLEHAALDLATGDGGLTAAGRASGEVTRVMPTLEPARAGLTNTGRPSAARSSNPVAMSARRTTRYAPTARPSARSSFLVYSLSMAAALPNTPAPT